MADDKRKPYILNNATMWIDGADRGHGDEVLLDPEHGDHLAELGVVVPKAQSPRADPGTAAEAPPPARRRSPRA